MTTIFDFASQLNASARANQFRVHIIFPTALVSNANMIEEQAEFLTHTAQLPSYQTNDIPVNFRGRVIHESGEKQYNTWSCTIYNSSDFAIRKAIEQWDNAIHDPEIIAGITIPRQYKSNILIEQLDRNDNTLRVYKLVGAYPTDTGTIELSYASTDIEAYTCQFVFDYFVVGGAELLGNAEYNGTGSL